MIPYGRQEVTRADIEAVLDVLQSDFLTQGPAIPRFEEAVARHVGADFGVAVNSATSALHVACLALGLRPGDILWTAPNTFVASANCGLYCGARVDFVDIDPVTWNMSVSALRAKLSLARDEGCLPRVVIPVHFSGQPTEQEEIWELAREYGFRVLEDASHAIGAARHGESVGSCRWSDITVFSFHPVKILTTGEGGLAVTNDAELAEGMAMLRTHGITRSSHRFSSESGGPEGSPVDGAGAAPWYYEQQVLGFNYRMTDILAALGLSQLERLGTYVEVRNRIARRYDAALAGLPLTLPTVRPENVSASHLYVVHLEKGATRKTHREVFDELRERGIGVNLHYMPVHLQPYFRQFGFKRGDYPEAEEHGASAISLPMFPTLTDDAQGTVIDALHATLADE
jgi:UDP-4-amino-4,6-dideoxy-N-acetyl-beta-L-altrosamine transaminase